ncbi:dTDP-4-dehydrorhamnose reductase [Clostridium sp. CAG:167]|nr:dTDP-4-dehydrorhamnose reductase [Clostridium sp. CAG:167]
MKVLVTGVAGQLGHDVMQELAKREIPAVGTDLKEGIPLDITDEKAVHQVLQKEKPTVIIHCAAWTAVDLAEEEQNKKTVYAVNVTGTENLAKEAAALGARFVYISTDYVFNGEGTKPWKPDCTEYAPLNYYGQTKWQGEQRVKQYLSSYFIVRIAWVFGLNGGNFIKTMLKVGKNHDRLTVVKDQIGTPTYTKDLARLLVDMIQTEKYGIYHATNEGGYISWYDFAAEIFRQAAVLDPAYDEEHLQVVPVTTEEYGVSKARRPFNSRLDRSKLVEQGFEPLPDWKDALARYIKEVM